MTLSSHWTGVKFLRKIDLELIWNHCWVFSVQECEHWDQFLRISSRTIFVLDSSISGPWRGPPRMRSIEDPLYLALCRSALTAACKMRPRGLGRARVHWAAPYPTTPHSSTSWFMVIRALLSFGPPSTHSFQNDFWISEVLFKKKKKILFLGKSGAKILHHCVGICLV